LPPNGSNSAAAVWAVLRKECRSEWRTRYGLNAALLFAVCTLTSVSFAVGRLPDRTDLLAALLWVVLLFAALASLAHAFVREVEGHTLTLLRLVASPSAIAKTCPARLATASAVSLSPAAALWARPMP